MATTHPTPVSHLLPVEEYLTTTYRPDVDYVDGHIEERNLGEFDHGDLQFGIANFLRNRQQEWKIRVVGETRVQVSPSRFRIPDVCVIAAGLAREPIIRTPPLLCIEILSPRDTLNAMRKRVQDFLTMGVPEVWIFDAATRTAHVVTASATTAQTTGTLMLPNSPVCLRLAEVFATLDA
ncbi:MAG: Uma2 family endonuclease [Acidobacteriota bacterium]|nr:Uma2 family endonuclease [Acidobacteriota bacterium]